MKFNKWSTDRILQGKKFLTSRKRSYDDDPMVEYVVGPLPLRFIKEFLYEHEGAESPDELQRVINQIFRRRVGIHEMFYVHVLVEEIQDLDSFELEVERANE